MYCITESSNKHDELEVSAVPSCWVVKGKLLWPSSSSNLTQLIKKRAKPQTTWSVHNCRILQSNLSKFCIFCS